MITDAFVDFICDSCTDSEQVTLPVVYSSMAGKDPHADLRDSALEKSIPRGWVELEGKHYCEDCVAQINKSLEQAGRRHAPQGESNGSD